MPESNNNRRIVFSLPEDTTIVDVIFDILKNNGLEETPDEACDKGSKGEPSRLIIIKDAARSIAENKSSEKDLTSSLQKQLNISKETAEKLINEIKKKIVSFAKEITIGQENISFSKIDSQEEDSQIEESFLTIKPLPLNNRAEIIEKNTIGKNPEKTKKTMEIPKRPQKTEKQNDIYREPIE